MKFALIFLSVFVVFSDQQFYNHRPSSSAERLFWLSRYNSRRHQPTFDDYDDQPLNYGDNQDDDDDSLHLPFRDFRPARPSESSHIIEPNFNAIEHSNDMEEENFPDVQSRRKVVNRFPTRNRPSFSKPKKSQNDPRFVINLASPYNLLNRKVKTITFTFTSSLTFTSVKSCIPSEQFSAGSADVTCRRKRREIVESHQGIESDDEMTQFSITPSDVQPFESTRLSSSLMDLMNKEDYGQRTDDGTFNRHQVVSSKDEDEVTSSPASYSREKRLFFHFVTTTTVISYSFLSTTVTKTVSLLNTLAFPGAYLICRPDGYAVCPYTANSFGAGGG